MAPRASWVPEACRTVALVSAGSFAAAVGAFAFHEAVRQETLVMLAVEHLGVLAEDVAVLVDFHQGFLNEFFVHGAFGARVIVKGSIPPPEEFSDSRVVSVG